ncbi:hypothetical protein SSX86_023676 [Deinandra increscens subsp. villosa]|uniref:C2H2-type domain-containing protein n=1 Tax=Deinandra increscens subsp. villosa TaxID=3103831 RepID=A0AAP0CQR5_9ASTR
MKNGRKSYLALFYLESSFKANVKNLLQQWSFGTNYVIMFPLITLEPLFSNSAGFSLVYKIYLKNAGVEVKSGKPLEVKLGEDKVLHLSQACLGEIKNTKTNDSVCLHITVQGKKLVLGTLNSERLPQQLFDLVIDKEFQLSHNWKNGSVYFYGFVIECFLCLDSDEEEEDLPLSVARGKNEVKKEDNQLVAKKKDGKQKVKIVEPEKDVKSEEDDSDSDDSDSMSEDDEDDSSDSEDDSDEEEETPKKEQSGKKRPNEAGLKTPASDKRAKMSTPQKTDGKKTVEHVATPHPSKPNKQAKSEAKSNQKSPAPSTDGAHSCKPCNRTFKSDGALQSHNQAKHK